MQMSIVVAIIISEVIFNIVSQTEALKELPKVEDNNILKAGYKIQDTINSLFSTLKFQGKKDNPNLIRLVIIHNYLMTVTSKDYNSITEVAKLTRVVARNDFNVSANFIEKINEIFDNNTNGVKTTEKDYDGDDDSINSYINNYMQNLAYITYLYSTTNPNLDNNELMQYFEEKVKDLQNTNSTNSTIQTEDDEFSEGLDTWKPEDVLQIRNTRRIYQGKRTRIKHFPFMASVQIFDKFTCGGSIIEDDLVLTAASCLQIAWNNRYYRENPTFLSVRIGSTFFESGGEKVEALEVYFHPSYNPTTLQNNLAIMRLVRKIRFSRYNRKRVMKIEFDKYDHPLPTNSEAITIVGWGAKTASNVLHNAWEQRLSFGVMGVFSFEGCQDIYSKKYVTNTNFCAGYMSKGSGACNRDVGGPGVVDGTLVGVISFGSPMCGASNSPTVFTKVGYYVDWIESIMEQPVIAQSRGTTTLKPDLDSLYAWEHTTQLEGMPQPIYASTNPTTEIEVEATTVEAQIEEELKNIIGKMLRKEKNEDSDSSDSNPKNILKTVKNRKTTVSALENQILEIIRASRMAEAATEVIPKYTAFNLSVNPTAVLDSSDDGDDYQEHLKKETELDLTRTRPIPANEAQEVQVSEQKIQPISSRQSNLNKNKPVSKFVQDMTSGNIFQDLNTKKNAKMYKPNELITMQNLQHDLELIKTIDSNLGKVKKLQQKRFKKPGYKKYYNGKEKIKHITKDTQPLQVEKLELIKGVSPVKVEQPKLSESVRPLRSKYLKDSDKNEPILSESLNPIQSEKSIPTSDVVLNLLYGSEKEKSNLSPELTRNGEYGENIEVNIPIATDNTVYDAVSKYGASNFGPEAKELSIHQDNANNLAYNNNNNNNNDHSIPGDKSRYISEYKKKLNFTFQKLLSEKDINAILAKALKDNLN